MGEVSKVSGLILFSALKFFLAPSTTVIAGYGFWSTIAITVCGGLLGFYVFFRFGEILQKSYQSLFRRKPKRKFNRKNKLIVKAKRSYGLWGLAIITPCLLGIPLGAFIASAYYRNRKGVLWVFFSFIVLWAFILTCITIYIKEI